MMSLLGCSPDELGGVLKSLGFRADRRPVAKAVQATLATAEASPASTEPIPAEAAEAVPEAAPAAPVGLDAAAPQSAASQAAAPAEAQTPASEPEFEEVWRPRRHIRGERRKEGAPRGKHRAETKEAAKQPTEPKQPAEPAQPVGTNGYTARPSAARDVRRERGKEGADRGRDTRPRRSNGPDRPRREERRKPEVLSAAPPRKSGVDADSPFAALEALRDVLAKRGKETSS